MNNPLSLKIKKFLRNIYCFLKLVKTPYSIIDFFKYFNLLSNDPALFSPNYYLQKNPDISTHNISPLVHYLVLGWEEGRDPNQDFNTKYYLKNNKDVQCMGRNPFLHYITHGYAEWRNPSEHIQALQYTADNPDILSLNISPIVHKYRSLDKESVQPDLTPSMSLNSKNHTFSKAVTVVIPVYFSKQESVDIFSLLIRSLIDSYPTPNINLKFIIIDDASPFPPLIKLKKFSSFIDRDDVLLLTNATNIGFVKSVNHGIKISSTVSDVVILNSDTEIHGSIFEILQKNCYRVPKIASVTPLSNRATIASLLNWPYGTDTIYSHSSRTVAKIIQKTGLISPEIDVPTGHGFCMYMSRASLKDVGVFDQTTFGHGYGEENDWSMRALRAGYRHRICTECFVFHHESMSFTSRQKKILKSRNSLKLSKAHPYYDAMIQKFLTTDPLNNHRSLLQLILKPVTQKKSQSLCFIIHDSFANYKGGVQQHIRQLIEELQQTNDVLNIIVLSPQSLSNKLYEITFISNSENIKLSELPSEQIPVILQQLNIQINYLHIHHTYGVDPYLLNWAKQLITDKKIFTIHDYDLFCSNPYLLDSNGVFCKRNSARTFCEQTTCKEPSEKNNNILLSCDKIFVPSENCKNLVRSLCDNESIVKKLETVPHFLDFADAPSEPPKSLGNATSRNLVFLGSLYEHKGGDIFLDNINEIEKLGFSTSIWGNAQVSLIEKYPKCPPIYQYHNWQELAELHKELGAHIVVLPSRCPETFSYTLHESIILLETPVIVGPYGHPAEMILTHKMGVVLKNTVHKSLLYAIKEIENNYTNYIKAIKIFKNNHAKMFSKKKYVQNYMNILKS